MKEKIGKTIEKIKVRVAKIFPFLKELLAEKVIPVAIKKGYEAFETFADEKIESLAAQVDKYESTLDDEKKIQYRKGIELGAKTLKAIADKLDVAAGIFLEAIK